MEQQLSEQEIAFLNGTEEQDESMALVVQANQQEVVSLESLEEANELVKVANEFIKQIKATFGPIREKAHQAHKEVIVQEKEKLAPFEKVKTIMSGKIAHYLAEEKRREQERIREEWEAEKKHLEAEQLKKAAEAAALGDDGEASMILSEKIEEKNIEVKPSEKTRKTKKVLGGAHLFETWKFEVVAESQIPREYLIPDLKLIGQIVRAQKEKTKIPGIRAYAEAGFKSK